MEVLNEIDWSYRKPSSTRFIEDESCIEKSCVFRLIDNTFDDDASKSNNCKSNKPAKKPTTDVLPDCSRIQTNKGYIPGFRRRSSPFPQKSSLTPEQHKLCIRVLRSIDDRCITMPKITINDREMQIYNNLIPMINEEQKLFMNYAKQFWETTGCKKRSIVPDKCEDVITDCWKSLLTTVRRYPTKYEWFKMVPLIYSNDDVPIELLHLKSIDNKGPVYRLKDMLLIHKYVLPSFDKKRGGRSNISDSSAKTVCEDATCEDLALENEANIVVSSSVLQTLADNFRPFNKTWSLPVSVREYNRNGKKWKVTYIDRALPPKDLTDRQKSQLFYERSVRRNCLRRIPNSGKKPDDCATDRCEEPLQEIDDSVNLESDVSDDERLVIDDSQFPEEIKSNKTPPIQGVQLRSKIKTKPKSNINTGDEDINFQYDLWKINQSKEKTKYCKATVEDITVLIRSKIDGFDPKDGKTVVLAPKLEYQLEYGVELASTSDAAKQWTAMRFRPESKLVRIRIDPVSKEVIMIEKLTLPVFSRETSKRSDWKPENIIGCYFNIFSEFRNLRPGNYLLRHEPKHAAFAALYSATNWSVANGLDLEKLYEDPKLHPVDDNVPWIPLDPTVVTPHLNAHNLMPCMFAPGKMNTKPKNQGKVVKKKKKNKKKK